MSSRTRGVRGRPRCHEQVNFKLVLLALSKQYIYARYLAGKRASGAAINSNISNITLLNKTLNIHNSKHAISGIKGLLLKVCAVHPP
jgi:hypothetical protein